MTASAITQLIINSPDEAPQRHRRYDREARLFDQVDGRHPAGYVVAQESSKAFDDARPEIPNRQAARPFATRLSLT